jgi:tRNA modification GTPase
MRVEDADTICAVSTPPGEGGISIIRISGPEAHPILKKIFRPRGKTPRKETYGRLRLGGIVDPADTREVDEVLAVLMAAPATYTREDIAEIHSHGGFAAQKAIMDLVMRQGARLAEPGEFTRRAFLNGRLDLVQAESVLDLIRSETDEELRYALTCLKGGLSRKMGLFRETLKQALVAVETTIDFPEEDLRIDLSGPFASLRKTKKEIDGLVSSYYEGKGLKQGFEVLILGRTNVGKSSLLNALVLRERAIVTPLPGTTRDLIEETLYLRGAKVRLIDTAGIRTPENVVEEEGIRRVKDKAAEADLIIWVIDGSLPYSDDDEKVFNDINEYNKLVVINKCDLTQQLDDNILLSKGITQPISISAKEGTGLDDLRSSLFSALAGNRRKNSLLITTLRHRDILMKVSSNIVAAMEGLEKGASPEILAFELHEALHHLGEITGETCPEEILDTIFSQFCIGK